MDGKSHRRDSYKRKSSLRGQWGQVRTCHGGLFLEVAGDQLAALFDPVGTCRLHPFLPGLLKALLASGLASSREATLETGSSWLC